MAKKVDHIGILVGNLDEALKLYEDCFGAELDRLETVPEQGVKAAVLSLGQGAKLELLNHFATVIWLESWRKEGRAFTI